MAGEEGDGEPRDQRKTTDQSGKKDGDTASLMCQLLVALKKQQEKPGNLSKGKIYNTKRPLHPVGMKS